LTPLALRMRRSATALLRTSARAPSVVSRGQVPSVGVRFLSATTDVHAVVEQKALLAKRELAVLASAFQRYDGDRNGTIDMEELATALSELDLTGEVDVETLFAQLDENKDGSIQLMEWLDNLPKGTRLRIVNLWEDGALEFDEGSAAEAYRHVRISVPSPYGRIVWTHTDEAPALASYSLLPIVQAFSKAANIAVVSKDISVAGRIIANFPEYLEEHQRIADELSELGEVCKTPMANVIKLPNVSASIPQLCDAIAELQSQGYHVPNFPMDPQTDEEKKVAARYSKIIGSAVNPVLREGNSDRRVAGPVKEYAQANPHKLGAWDPASKSHVAHMDDGDFYSSEQSYVMPAAGSVRIEHVDADGTVTVLKSSTALQAGEVIDAAVMRVNKLRDFFEREIQDAKDKDVLLSLHLKATMMKVSDPIMFGHAVEVYFKDVFAKHGATFAELGVNAKNGLQDVYAKIAALPEAQRAEIEADIMATYETRPKLAMVDSGRGITNLHVPNDIIIDASMPCVVRDSGKMWTPEDSLHDTKALIPDRCYAGIYQEIMSFCKKNGQFDVSSMGNVPNVGLMAQKAQEYGSHDKTFEIPSSGTVRVVTAEGKEVFSHSVAQGDIWRMCQTKDSPIQDWVKLAVSRARATGNPAVFWLTPERAHDANLITKVGEYLKEHDTTSLDIRILPPVDAMRLSCERAAQGLDTISVTGNVLRDYLTDLFPIIELGTSAKMLSIVPLLAGGGLFETGAGGSAPKHVQQMVKENHLRWDSLGEFLALAVSLEDLGVKTGNTKARILADGLNAATSRLLMENKSPRRKCGELDNRGSHFYIAMYWAQALAQQNMDSEIAATFSDAAALLTSQEQVIVDELNSVQGAGVDLGGYFQPNPALAAAAMRPSPTLNAIVDALFKASAGEPQAAAAQMQGIFDGKDQIAA